MDRFALSRRVRKTACRRSLPPLLAACCALWFHGISHAALEPGVKTPYRLQVVLHVANNRILTEALQKRLEREIREDLELTYGPLARVEVVRWHPLLSEVLTRGLQQALDGWEELSDRKTHFLLLDYAGGYYELQARQHDGLTGQNSPVVRRDRVADRRRIARRAARLIDRDFGLVGTVEKSGDEVRLLLRGGDLGVSLQPWLRPGDVFAVVRLTKEGENRRATRLPWALLQAVEEPRQGMCRCRFYHRFTTTSLDEPNVLGYRALRLTTITAPARLRFLDETSGQPLDHLQVHLAATEADSKVREMTTNRDGLVVSKEPFANLVFVRVFSGSTLKARFLVELVDDRTVVCRLRMDSQADALDSLEFRKELWLRRIYDNLLVAADRVSDLNEQLKKSLESTLAGAREGLKELNEELAALDQEHDQLVSEKTRNRLGQFDLREGEQRLEDLRERQKELEKFVNRIDSAIRDSRSDRDKGLVKLLESASLLEARAEYAKAIVLYRRVLQVAPDQLKVQERLEKLETAWKPRSEEHAKAREFIYNVWPDPDLAKLKARLPEVKKAFAICRQNGDRLTPRKLLMVNVVHAANLKKRVAILLKREDSEDSRVEARTITQVIAALRQLHGEVTAYLKSKE
jgi:tetratricopeptide (TPR) repeat protein